MCCCWRWGVRTRWPAIWSARSRTRPRRTRFADIGYFRTDFARLTRLFPAHLHINLDQRFRGQGIGARLIEAFAAIARRAGAPGVHAVTGRGMRNVGFYQRCGFFERGSALWNGGEIVFLGRSLL